LKAAKLFTQYPWMKFLFISLSVVVLILFNQGCILAFEPIAGLAEMELPAKITFSEGRNSYTFPLEDIGLEITYNWDGEVFSGYLLACRDEDRLTEGIQELVRLIDHPAGEAELKLDDQGKLVVLPAHEGRKVAQEDLYQSLVNGCPYQENIPLVIQTVQPAITQDMLQDQMPDNLWAVYSTLLTNIPDRTENVRIASSSLNGVILAPGQEFSFNAQVGPREKERGFREAKVIVGGSFEPGLGGGVCQVSSTLYNAVLLAGLEIKERHNHSVRIAYVPLGRDATVLYGAKDFKFSNNTPGYIMIRTKLTGLQLEMAIYGKGASPYEKVEITTKLLKTVAATEKTYVDPRLPTGAKKLLEKGQNGYLSETYRSLGKGAQVTQELLSRDFYVPQPHLYAVGGKSD